MNFKTFVINNRIKILLLSLAIYFNPSYSQKNTIEKVNNELLTLKLKKDSLNKILEDLILNKNISSIESTIIPKLINDEKYIEHSAIVLAYDEKHEQAKWVAHIINTNIIDGTVSRTNNFRKDPLVLT